MNKKTAIIILITLTVLSGIVVFYAFKKSTGRPETNILAPEENEEPLKAMTKEEKISEATQALNSISGNIDDAEKEIKIKEAEDVLNNIKINQKKTEETEDALKALNNVNNK